MIFWSDASGKVVFQWDENPNGPAKDGPHYHIKELPKGNHFYPGMPVPDPWASIYF